MTRVSTKQLLQRGSLILGSLLVFSVMLALRFGASDMETAQLYNALLHPENSDEIGFVVWNLRLPRILVSGLVGASLAAAGAIFQALLRNPLADPFILGISGGAAAGAVVAISIGLTQTLSPPVAAFAGAMAAMILVYSTARRNGHVHTDTLLLVGVVANAFFSAIILFVLAIADPNTLMRSYHWMMGHLASAGTAEAAYLGPVVVIAGLAILWDARRVHLLQLGTETAWHLGVNVERLELRMYFAACLLTAGAVAAAGMIGFVGLITPHVIRRLFTNDFRVLFPLSLVGGAVLMILSDTAARTVIAPSELPVGVLTASIGAPVFLWLLRRRLS